MTEMKIKTQSTEKDFEIGDTLVCTDVADGVCFKNRTDDDSIFLLKDIAENTDWDKLKANIGGTCDREASFRVGSHGLVLEMQWTTGLDFADGHEGGGYLAEISFDGYSPSVAFVLVEWNDDWIEEHGIEGREDEANCMGLIVDALKFGAEKLA